MEAKNYFEWGFEKQLNEKYKEAIECYDKTLKLDDKFERAFIQRAFCKFQLENYDGALCDCIRAIDLNPNDPITYLNAGWAKYSIDANTQDTTYLDKAIELSANMAEAYYLRGLILSNKEDYNSAIVDFTKSIEHDYLPNVCYYRRAYCYRYLEKYDNALLDFYKVIELDTDDKYLTAEAYFEIGIIKQLYEQLEEAMRCYQKAKELSPDMESINEFLEICQEALDSK